MSIRRRNEATLDQYARRIRIKDLPRYLGASSENADGAEGAAQAPANTAATPGGAAVTPEPRAPTDTTTGAAGIVSTPPPTHEHRERPDASAPGGF